MEPNILLMRQLFVRVHADLNGSKESDDGWVCDFVARMLNSSKLEIGLQCLDLFNGAWKPYVKGVIGSARP